MKKLIVELDDKLKRKIQIKIAKIGKTLKEITTELFEKWVKE